MQILKLAIGLLLMLATIESVEKIDCQYLPIYGDEQSPVKVVEYFSFQCPHCIAFFKSDFAKIKKELIDTGKISFEFHPVPLDLPTIQAMICLSQLEQLKKQLFLEVILEEAVPGDSELMAKLMMTAMNVFQKPIPELDNPEFIKKHKAFNDAYLFLKQEEKVLAVPAVEVDGKLFPSDVPDFKFIQSVTKRQE